MNKFELTQELFDLIRPGEILCFGYAKNNPEGLFMTDSNPDRMILWVAVKGWANDWTMYCGWLDEHNIGSICREGDKVLDHRNIYNVMNVDSQLMKRYRY